MRSAGESIELSLTVLAILLLIVELVDLSKVSQSIEQFEGTGRGGGCVNVANET